MKKILALLFFLILLPVLSACKQNSPYLSRVSELKDGLFYGESENYSLTVSAGKREEPYLIDGVVGNICPHFNLKVKVKSSFSLGEDFSVSALVNGKNYGAALTYSEGSDCFRAALSATEIPTQSFSVTIYRNGISETMEATPPAVDRISYQTALSSSADYFEKQLSPYIEKGVFQGEVQIRLTFVNDATYWFITFAIDKEKTFSALVDAESGEILATKTD